MAAEACRHEARAPNVLADRRHGDDDPVVAARRRVQKRTSDALVALDDRVDLDFDRLAEHALDGRTAAIHSRTDLLDEYAAASVVWQFHAVFVGVMTSARSKLYAAGRRAARRL
jgi:hypothetical protein